MGLNWPTLVVVAGNVLRVHVHLTVFLSCIFQGSERHRLQISIAAGQDPSLLFNSRGLLMLLRYGFKPNSAGGCGVWCIALQLLSLSGCL